MKVVVISGSPRKISNTKTMMDYVYEYTKTKNESTTFVNLSDEEMNYYRGPGQKYSDTTMKFAKDITEADVWLIGSPIYNSFFSSALKNLFEFINYKSTAGKVAGMAILASGNIGFTDVQTLITQLMSYFRVITNPKAVFITADMIKDGQIINEDQKSRLKDLVDETLALATKLN